MQKQAWLWIAAGAGTGPTIVDTLSRRSCDSVGGGVSHAVREGDGLAEGLIGRHRTAPVSSLTISAPTV